MSQADWRDNLDPLGSKTDVELNDALNLIHGTNSTSHGTKDKFHLDGPVLAEGSNFSAGEKQLRESACIVSAALLMSSGAHASVGPRLQGASTGRGHLERRPGN